MPVQHPHPSPRPKARLIRRSALVPVMALGLAVSACQAPQTTAEAPQGDDVVSAPIGDKTIVEGGDLVMALSAEPDRLDPTTSSSLYTRYVMQTMCQKLYDIDANGEIIPQLATELPEVSEDGLTVRIPVRDDAQFADGTPFNAEAVAQTIDRGVNLEGSSRKSELGPIEKVVAVDDTTVEVTYAEPFAPLTAALADRAGMILSPKALEEKGEAFGDSPVCVGPFKFVERVPQTSIKVERDPLYYDAENVHLDTITYRIITDSNIRAANLRSGDVQVADTISTQDVDELMSQEGVNVLQVGSLGYQAMTINLGNTDGVGTPPGVIDTPIATDPNIRMALSMSIDREALVQSVFGGYNETACSPISPASPFTSEASEACPEYDPEAAKSMLEDAGVEMPYKITMQVTNNPDTIRFAQALQAAVADGGFEIEILPVEYSTLLDVQSRGDFEALQLGWSGRIDPHGNMFNFLSTGGGNNYSGYSNPEVDELMTESAQSNDIAERADLYGQAVAQIQEDNPIIYLYRQRNITAHTTDVAGVETFADGVVHLSNAAFVEAE
ncbi:peptide/nickel transport system substrate-binding protein [Arthrobacter subterraneus]|uniref:Peptide/nickel transport system substrate-binding protein n=1 Tax=Arthrobacter subterraneus TaxID=335973 RepID=A0A1G8IKC6_9MICC|nr:ABC transporter substrate-binding protein [Arthrobacter subterraneus]SDI19241.1 peptide/nickel transport system substrate-binding protein [Arthrobacter subterraneus]